jgi:Transglutaminase-like superfamily
VVGMGLRRHPEGAVIADRLGLPELALDDWRFAPRGARRLSLLCSAPTVSEKAKVVRSALVPSPARVRFEPGLSAGGGPPLVVGYLRYWRTAGRSMRAALRFVVDDRSRRRLRGDLPQRASWSDRLLMLEAGLCLGWTRAAVLLLPFRWVTLALGQQLGETPTADDPASLSQRRRVARAVQRISRHTPWASNCLTQALAGKQMLRRRGIRSTLYLGVAKDAQTNLKAHAWLRSGTVTLTGGDHLERFTVITSFADAPEKPVFHRRAGRARSE